MKRHLMLLLFVALLSFTNVSAQDDEDDDDLPPTDDPGVPALPIDYWIPVLAIAGVAYSARYFLINKKL